MSFNQSARRARVLLGCLALFLVAACASTRKLAEPVPMANAAPIATAADSRVAATIDAVIVRDGPGAWAKSADWDEYLIRVQVTTDAPVEITGAAIVDSLDDRHERETYRPKLLKQSKKTARRYKEQDLEVTAGLGGAGVFFTGYLVGGASAMAGLATLGTGAAGAAAIAGALVVAPVLMTAGIVGVVQEHRVDREIQRRSSVLPMTIEAQQSLVLDVFFPLAPAPRRVELRYEDTAGPHVLVIDTGAALAGLHLLPGEPTAPAADEEGEPAP